MLARLSGVFKGYREGDQTREVLRGANLEVHRGETVVLLGRSGSGKSTLLNLLAGIDLPDAGSVSLDGVALSALSEQRRTLFRRRHIGFIYQFFNLIPTLTVAENVLLPLELNGVARRAGLAQVRGLLAEVGIDDRAESFPDHLSGGEQQRVAVARALVHAPSLLLADEPTGNLDGATGEQMLGLIARLTRAAGHTLVMVTHSQGALRYADRVLELRDGRPMERDGPPAPSAR